MLLPEKQRLNLTIFPPSQGPQWSLRKNQQTPSLFSDAALPVAEEPEAMQSLGGALVPPQRSVNTVTSDERRAGFWCLNHHRVAGSVALCLLRQKKKKERLKLTNNTGLGDPQAPPMILLTEAPVSAPFSLPRNLNFKTILADKQYNMCPIIVLIQR